MKILKITILFVLCVFSSQCSGGGNSGIFTSLNQVAVDSTNDRLFLAQSNQQLFVLVASDQSNLGDQPALSENTNETIANELPEIITHFVAFASGSNTRLFIFGRQLNSNGVGVLNRILVLDYNGTTFTEASFSPIVLSDENAATDEEDNSIASVAIDAANSRLYVSDTSAGVIYVINTEDGTAVRSPLVVAGTLQGLSFYDDHLYVCNSSSIDAEQVITVFDTTDFSSTTIDIDAPCDKISVNGNTSGTVFLAKKNNINEVVIRRVDTTTYASSSTVVAGTTNFNDGLLTSGKGISSSISAIQLFLDSSGDVHAYLSEIDGNLQHILFAGDLSAYTAQTLSTVVLRLGNISGRLNTLAETSYVFVVSGAGSLLTIEPGETDITVIN